MAVIDEVHFSGTAGVSISVANTPALSAVTATVGVFNDSVPPGYAGGTSSNRHNQAVTGNERLDYTATADLWTEFYFWLEATSASNSTFFQWFNTATKVCEVRILAGAQTLQVRDDVTAKGTGPTMALATWHRVVVHHHANSATGLRMKLYLGSNRDGSTPDYDSGDQTCTSAAQTQTNRFHMGLISGPESHYRIAGVRVHSTEPTPSGPTPLPYDIDFVGTTGNPMTLVTTPELSAVANVAGTFNADIPVDGSDKSVDFDIASSGTAATGTSYNDVDFDTQPEAWIGFYFNLVERPPVNAFLGQWLSDVATKIGELRVNGSASSPITLSLRDNITAVATSPAITLNTWNRIAIRCLPGSATGHRLKLYLGSNRHGTTATYDSGNVAANSAAQTNIDLFRFGLMTVNTEIHWRIHRLRVWSTEPDGLTATTFNKYAAIGGSWVGVDEFALVGGAWS